MTSEDVNSLFDLFANEAVVRFYDLDAFTDTLQAMNLLNLFESRYESSSGIRWAIRLKENGRLIGTCGFNSWSAKMKNANIGYDLMPSHWNRGIATEAVCEIIRAAFTGRLPCGALHRIQADTIPGNAASERVLQKLGFREEGLRRGSVYIRGGFKDLKCFGLLDHEFKQSQ